MHKLLLYKNITIKDRNVIFHYLEDIFKTFGDIWVKIQGMVYTEGDIHLKNICLMKNILNDKKVKDGVSKEYIVKNDKNIKTIHWVVFLSNKENKKNN